nr:RNA polymerase sigma factor [Bacteroidota bacterium]
MTVSEYNACVDKYADGVYRFILKNYRDVEGSKDVVQETFTRLWDKRKDVFYEKAKTYIFTTAYHAMIDMIRKEKNSARFSDDHENKLTVENSFSDLNEILHDALNRLPEIQRTVVLLRDYEGYAYKEIGEITNLNEAQVKVYIFRARNALKQFIGSLDHVI